MSEESERTMLKMNLGVLNGLLIKFGRCEKQIDVISRGPDFEGKQMALVVLEAVRFMHARMHETASLMHWGLLTEPERVAAVQAGAVKLDDALADWVGRDLISQFAANYITGVLRDQIALRDEEASTRLEIPRTRAAIAALSRAEAGEPSAEDPEMPGPTFTAEDLP